MKPRTSTLPQAHKRLLEVMEGANEVAQFLDDLSAKLGLSQVGATSQSANGRMPPTMSDRVIKIIIDAAKPLKPKDIVNRYQQLGWTEPTGGRTKLYEAVSGSLSYLLNRKRVLQKTKKGYSIKSKEEEK